MFSSLSRDLLNHELPSLYPVSIHLWKMQDNRLQLYNYVFYYFIVFYDVAINGFCQLIKHNQSILESVPNQKVSDVCSLDLY